jgi:hypothetical protein
MAIEFPHAGQVINYSYLWRNEADEGREEGRKNRPCAVVLAQEAGRVVLAPITHSPPQAGSTAIEIPQQIKRQLGLDNETSWIVTSEVNAFSWPGYDLVPINRSNPGEIVFGTLPASLTKLILKRIKANALAKRLDHIDRD